MTTALIFREGHGTLAVARAAGLLLVLLSLASTACSYRSPAMLASPTDLPPVSTAAYQVRVADTLDIGFFQSETLNQSRKVGPNGGIQLMLIGRVDVVGRTLSDVKDELTERYGEELVDPQLTVSVQEFSAMTV